MTTIRPPDVQGSNPVEKDRQPTDQRFIFLYAIILILWCVIGTLSVLNSNESEDSNSSAVETRRSLKQILRLIREPIKKFQILTVVWLFLILGVFWVYIFLLKIWTLFFMWFLIVKSIVDFSNFATLMEGENTAIKTISTFFGFEVKFLYFVPLIAAVVSLWVIRMEGTKHIIKNSCQVILSSPALISIIGLLWIIEYIILVFTANALVAVIISDRPESTIWLLSLTNLCLGIVVQSIFFNVGRMTIYHYTINYYWENDGQPEILNSIAYAWRYHIGTITVSSTKIIPCSFAIIEAIKYKPTWERKEHYFFYLQAKILLIIQMPEKLLIFTSIHGTDFLKSSRQAFDTVLHRCKFYLATTWVLQYMLYSPFNNKIFLTLFTGIYLKENKHLIDGLPGHDKKTDEKILEYIYMSMFTESFISTLMHFLVFTAAEALFINEIMIPNNQD